MVLAAGTSSCSTSNALAITRHQYGNASDVTAGTSEAFNKPKFHRIRA